MNKGCDFQFRIASTAWEFAAIHRLNYKTFVTEIPQHSPRSADLSEQRLVDKFHDENTYIICTVGNTLVGMLALRDKRPFSLDSKLPNLDSYLPFSGPMCEIRLLAIEKEYRHSLIFGGLMREVEKYCRTKDYVCLLLSGTTRQLKLYQNLGCVPFGPLVGNSNAQFQPMYLCWNNFEKETKPFFRFRISSARRNEPLSFLPGPVRVPEEVGKAFANKPSYHRSPDFATKLEQTRKMLSSLVRAKHVQILTGSGTLANECVASHLGLLKAKGLVLSNGEFGDRLINQATRHKLQFHPYQIPWGESFDSEQLTAKASTLTPGDWIWAVHSETSTGTLNDVALLQELALKHRLHLALDCISSIGTVSIDLSQVFMASGVSGKALCSYPGLSFVFYNHEMHIDNSLPRYFDLGFYEQHRGVPFTLSSNLMAALHQALLIFPKEDAFTKIRALSSWARNELLAMGYQLVAPKELAAPAVITITLPQEYDAQKTGQILEQNGFLLGFSSAYLRQKNWIQMYLPWTVTPEDLAALLHTLSHQSALKNKPRRENLPSLIRPSTSATANS